MWLSFAGSLSSSCAGLITLAIPIRYGCVKSSLLPDVFSLSPTHTHYREPTQANSFPVLYIMFSPGFTLLGLTLSALARPHLASDLLYKSILSSFPHCLSHVSRKQPCQTQPDPLELVTKRQQSALQLLGSSARAVYVVATGICEAPVTDFLMGIRIENDSSGSIRGREGNTDE